jgi:hypothetical protein
VSIKKGAALYNPLKQTTGKPTPYDEEQIYGFFFSRLIIEKK